MLLNRRTFLAGSAVAAASLGLGLAGCSEQKPAQEQGKGGGELTGAAAYEAKTYMPLNNSTALAVASNWHVVEGLYDLDLVTFTPYKALAADEPVKVSDTEYEVTLRDGAKFSDGTPVTSNDVVESFNRTVGAKGALYKSMIDFIDHMEAKDEKTVKVILSHPFTLVKERLCLVRVVPAAASDEDLTKMPTGSGPWKYESIDEKEIHFVPNEHYNGPKPTIDNKMKWDIIKDATARTTALSEGAVMVMENVPPENQSQLTSGGATVESVQGFNLPFLMFNTKKAPFDNNKVRQAFFYAIDTNKLIENAMAGQASVVKSFLPEGHKNFHAASTQFTYKPEEAKKLLADAGVSDLSITLQSTDHPWIKALSPQIKNDLEAVGIKVDINEQASAALYANQTDVENPVFDVVLAPGDPSVFGNDPDLLMNWWYGDNTWTQKRSQWKDSEGYNELHKHMTKAVESSGKEQQEAWNKCFDILSEQVPLYPLFHRKVATGYYADKIANFQPIGTTGLCFLGASTK